MNSALKVLSILPWVRKKKAKFIWKSNPSHKVDFHSPRILASLNPFTSNSSYLIHFLMLNYNRPIYNLYFSHFYGVICCVALLYVDNGPVEVRNVRNTLLSIAFFNIERFTCSCNYRVYLETSGNNRPKIVRDPSDGNEDDTFISECEELVEYFKTKTLEALLKCVRHSLDLIKRRLVFLLLFWFASSPRG